MSFVKQLSPERLEAFTNLVGAGLVTTLTAIRTRYVDDSEDHSGTGLNVSDGQLKYVLTAAHVLNPANRVPPQRLPTKRHYHTLNMKKDGKKITPFALRFQYWKSDDLDLAMIESTLSGRPDFDRREDYYAAREFRNLEEFDVYNDDLFVVCGFPEARMTSIAATREVNHGMLIHYFSGSDGSNDPYDKTRYRFKYDGSLTHPAGLSGSPVWLLRNRGDLNRPITAKYLSEQSGKGISLLAKFCGIVTNYYSESREVSAVRREVCAEFVHDAIEKLPDLRISEEDKWIDEELSYLKDRGRAT